MTLMGINSVMTLMIIDSAATLINSAVTLMGIDSAMILINEN